MGKVWLKKSNKGCKQCDFRKNKLCWVALDSLCCEGDSSLHLITEQQFNATPGKKHSIKNGVRTELDEDIEYAEAMVIMEDKK